MRVLCKHVAEHISPFNGFCKNVNICHTRRRYCVFCNPCDFLSRKWGVERMSLCMFVAFHLKCFENIPIEIFVKFINADYVLCVAMDIFLCGKTCLHARMIPLNSPNCWHLGLFL